MKNKKLVIGVLLTIVILLFGFYAYNYMNIIKKTEGEKIISVTINSERDDFSETITHKTQILNLGEALVEMGIIAFDDTEYGKYIHTVSDIYADSDSEEWWKISVNGEDAMVGADEIAINDGDDINIDLVVGFN